MQVFVKIRKTNYTEFMNCYHCSMYYNQMETYKNWIDPRQEMSKFELVQNKSEFV